MAEETKETKINDFGIDGIVARRDNLPYIQISKNGEKIAQFSMAEARNIANDILIMCSRVEADAILFKFFKKNQFPEGAAAALMVDFRDFRIALDMERVRKTIGEPSNDEKKNNEERFYNLMNFLKEEGLELDSAMIDSLKEKFVKYR